MRCGGCCARSASGAKHSKNESNLTRGIDLLPRFGRITRVPLWFGGCRITPMNRIVPTGFLAARRGRADRRRWRAARSWSRCDRRHRRGFRPSSSTSTYVLCLTSVMHSSEGTWMRVKSAVSGSQPKAMPCKRRERGNQAEVVRNLELREVDFRFSGPRVASTRPLVCCQRVNQVIDAAGIVGSTIVMENAAPPYDRSKIVAYGR